jgi:hypothetical protein
MISPVGHILPAGVAESRAIRVVVDDDDDAGASGAGGRQRRLDEAFPHFHGPLKKAKTEATTSARKRAKTWDQIWSQDPAKRALGKVSADKMSFVCVCGSSLSVVSEDGGRASTGNIAKHTDNCNVAKACVQVRAQTSNSSHPAAAAAASGQLTLQESTGSGPFHQSRFDTLVIDAVVEASLSLRAMQQPAMKRLLEEGRVRPVKVKSRPAMRKQLLDACTRFHDKTARPSVRSARALHFTSDLWTDRTTRPFLVITAHYFDNNFILRSPILAMKHVPKDASAGHTAAVLRAEIESLLHAELGENWRDVSRSLVVDGGANIKKAAADINLGDHGARVCVQHNLQSFLRRFIAEDRAISSVLATSNYLSKVTKLSGKVQAALGSLTTGVVTRWNSYLECARSVIKARDKIDAFWSDDNLALLPAALARAMATHRENMQRNAGFQILICLTCLLGPAMEVTISEEGDKYVTASAVLPKLAAARSHMMKIFRAAREASDSTVTIRFDGQDLSRARLLDWRHKIDVLWRMYIQPFFDHKLLVAATSLDFRFRHRLAELGAKAPNLAVEHVRDTFQKLYDADRSPAADAAAGSPDDGGGGRVAREAAVDPMLVAAVGEEQARHAAQEQLASERAQRTSEVAFVDELMAFSAAACRFAEGNGSDRACPSSLFVQAEAQSKFPYISKVALDILAAPAGEAPSERAFSIAGRIIRHECTRTTPQLLCELTRYKKNRLVFSVRGDRM